MWRYRELMPLFDGEEPLTLGEGWTPLIHATRLGARLGLERLFVKDESLNPTNSFKARGLSRRRDAREVSRRADAVSPVGGQRRQRDGGLRGGGRHRGEGVHAADVKVPFIRECELYGAEVTLVDGLITDAGRIAAERGKPLGWYDVSTLKEPYRIEGKKTMAYELGEQLGWTFPDWIIYPTGGGTGMVGMWKAFDEMERIGWKPTGIAAEDGFGAGRALRADRPRLRTGRRAIGDVAERAAPSPDGLRVPKAVGDFLVLRAVRESGGTALAVTDRRHGDRDARARQRAKASAPLRKVARRCTRSRCSPPTAASSRPTPSSCSTPAAR